MEEPTGFQGNCAVCGGRLIPLVKQISISIPVPLSDAVFGPGSKNQGQQSTTSISFRKCPTCSIVYDK